MLVLLKYTAAHVLHGSIKVLLVSYVITKPDPHMLCLNESYHKTVVLFGTVIISFRDERLG